MLNRKRVFKVDIFQQKKEKNSKATSFVCRGPSSKNNTQLRRRKKKEKMTFTDLWMHIWVKSTSTVKSTFLPPPGLKSLPLWFPSSWTSFSQQINFKREERNVLSPSSWITLHITLCCEPMTWISPVPLDKDANFPLSSNRARFHYNNQPTPQFKLERKSIKIGRWELTPRWEPDATGFHRIGPSVPKFVVLFV